MSKNNQAALRHDAVRLPLALQANQARRIVARMSTNAPPATATPGNAVSQGMAFMVIAMLMLPGIDAIAKSLAGSVAPGQISWTRFLFQVLLLAPLVMANGGVQLDRTIWAHALRGFLIALATVLFFTAIRVMPLADAIAIFFVQPFVVTILAAVLLGETFGWRRMIAIMVGFAGALLIIKPSYEVFGTTALLPVGTAIAFACYVILTRWLAKSQSAINMQFLTGLFGVLAMSIALLIGNQVKVEVLVPVWPTPPQWALLALLGLIATGGHILVVMAFSRAPVAVLAPFQYLEIVSSALLGYLLFRDFPDALTWIGIAIIVASGLYVFYREHRLSRSGP